MKVHFLFKAVLAAQLGLFSSGALAAEKLAYDSAITRSSFERIKSFSVNNLNSSPFGFDIAKADLNNDGLLEFITREKHCRNAGVCRFDALAETDEGIHALGTFEGGNLLLGNEFTHGVRNILIFSNATNDFDYDLYTWHPESSSYKKASR